MEERSRYCWNAWTNAAVAIFIHQAIKSIFVYSASASVLLAWQRLKNESPRCTSIHKTYEKKRCCSDAGTGSSC